MLNQPQGNYMIVDLKDIIRIDLVTAQIRPEQDIKQYGLLKGID